MKVRRRRVLGKGRRLSGGFSSAAVKWGENKSGGNGGVRSMVVHMRVVDVLERPKRWPRLRFVR